VHFKAEISAPFVTQNVSQLIKLACKKVEPNAYMQKLIHFNVSKNQGCRGYGDSHGIPMGMGMGWVWGL